VLSRSSHTDDLGALQSRALSPRPSSGYVGALRRGASCTPLCFDVVAPSDDVDLNVQGVRLVLRVRWNDHQPLDAEVTLTRRVWQRNIGDSGVIGGMFSFLRNQLHVDVEKEASRAQAFT